MREIRSKCSFAAFWALVSAGYAIVFLGIEFAGSPVAGVKGWLTLGAQWATVSVAAAALFLLLMLSRNVFAVASPLLLLASGTAGYYRITMGLSITPTIVELALTNNLATWATVMSPTLLVVMALSLAAGAMLGWLRWRAVGPPAYPAVWGLAGAIVLATPLFFVGRLRAPVVSRMPFSFYYAVSDYLANRRAVSENRDTFCHTTVEADCQAPMVVVVIGESLRPDHLQLNGYERSTTPLLAQDTAIVSFARMTTVPCYTHVSVPHIVTRADSMAPDRAFSEQSFITLFKRAGIATAWLSNQDAVDSYSYFMHEADTLVRVNGARTLYSFDKWLDDDLLPSYRGFLARNSGAGLVVMHTIGSHWWYPSHYPDSLARFTPEVDSRILSELTHEQIINSYDNTILAMDAFLAKVISELRGRNAVMIYVSDHGEALGEDGHYLHADDYEPLHSTACLVWYSPEYARRYPSKVSALRANASLSRSTDVIFHTVIDAAGLCTPVLNPQMSLLRKND